ncbi:hypothetical protein WICPIJ_006199 [Wickerhamomyces pijperi]|uniref:Protein kinase domain-containing protein n=1 Tax=Wickerhamomyces pijperi TaxID=599730 RepID=A0A9P8Q4Q6_WICPI|nr:hypothetical protein WICPIJ_006199 [Wickerhamomyces pijperi]
MSTQTTSGPALSMIPLQRVKCHTTVEIDTASRDSSIHRSHVGRHSGSESSEDEENIFLGEEFVPYDPSCDITHRDSVTDCYTIQKTLGSGGYGSVSVVATKPGHNFLRDIKKFKKPVDSLLEFGKSWRYENKFSFKGIYAMKEQAVSAVPGGDVLRCPEVEFIYNVPYHPNLLRVYEVFTATKNNESQLYITMEAMADSLSGQMKQNTKDKTPFSAKEVKSILRQLLQSLEHIHSLGFVHRDIKPDNLLMTPTNAHFDKSVDGTTGTGMVSFDDYYTVKLADYGLAMNVDQDTSKYGIAGTMVYMAPEVLLGFFHDAPVDIWAVGLVAYELITGERFFGAADSYDELLYDMAQKMGRPFELAEEEEEDDDEEERGEDYAPCFGYWEGFGDWMEKKEIDVTGPDCKPYTLQDLAEQFKQVTKDDKEYEGLDEVFQKCLMWDPEQRATAKELLNLSYFKN